MFKNIFSIVLLLITVFLAELVITDIALAENVYDPMELKSLKEKEENHRRMYLKLRRERRIYRKRMAKKLAKIRKITRKQEREEKKDLRKRQTTEIRSIKNEYIAERRRLYNEIEKIKKEIRLLRKNYKKDIRSTYKRHRLERKELRKKQLERQYDLLKNPEKKNEIKPLTMKIEKAIVKNETKLPIAEIAEADFSQFRMEKKSIEKPFIDNNTIDSLEADFKGEELTELEAITTPET